MCLVKCPALKLTATSAYDAYVGAGTDEAQYDKVSFALHEVMEKGYGIVSPSTEELTLDEPKIVKQGGRFGVKLKASAPSIHMIRADIETEVSPIGRY